ncbi:MAG: polysaccharide pyruvyl transferase CsaB [Eubacteriales bacterium]|nr:polysaccharide pyruvyl transferase CsaB [Eubacteriales bacterium]
MKVLHMIGGGDVGGAKIHVLSLVKELGKYIDVKIIALRPGEFAEDARKMGIDIEVVKSHNFIADIKKTIDIIKSGGYRIVHSHGAKANMFAFFVKRHTDIPTVTTVHSDYRLDYLQTFLKRYTFGLINTIALRFVDYYVTVSNRFKDMLIERKFNYENIYTVYNGMDFSIPLPEYSKESFLKRFNLKVNEGDLLVGILARLVPVKGVDTFIEAAADIAKVSDNIKFLIGGDGEDRRKLERKVKSLGLESRVFFLGWIDDSYEFLASININVLSSLSETFPYSILEGVKAMKPTISTNVGGIPDLIENGRNGFLFNSGDHKELARCILELSENSEKRSIMPERLYEKASKNFSLDSMCRTQLKIYNSILERESGDKAALKHYDAMISGYYGFKNIGDDAMLQAILDDIRRFKPDARLTILTSDPIEARKAYGINSINRINFLKIFNTMKKTSLFVYGGGTLIQESTSTRSLLYYLFIIWAAKKQGLNVMLYANGIEPINKYLNRQMTKKAMNSLDLITLREEESLKELKSLGIDRPRTEVTADPAFSIEPAGKEVVDEILITEGMGMGNEGPFIGFSARRWDGFRYTEEKNAETTLASIADYMAEKYGAVPVMIPMQPDDLIILDNIVLKMKTKAIVIRRKCSADEVLGITSRMEIMVGMRLHSLVFAASVGVPVVGLVYEPKVNSFLKHIGQENASAGSVKDIEFKRLCGLVEEVWNNRDQTSSEIKTSVEELKKKALSNAELAVGLMHKEEQGNKKNN